MDFEEALARALDVDGQMQMNTTDSRHHTMWVMVVSII